MRILFTTLILFFATSVFSQTTNIAVVKYGGGGDWYANPTSLPNLIRFCNQNLNTSLNPVAATVEVGSSDLFNYPFVHLTGHGNVLFSEREAANLRNYLIGGGFLHIDDNYGLDPFIRREMQKVFPEIAPIELPFTHPIFHQKFKFPNGLPKVHEHDGKRPQGFAWIYNGRVVVFYSYETDLGNGWEDPEVHNNSEAVRLKALQMGANIVQFAFTQ
ncbi:MAG: DUF4159 domain-containing protein [Bacteroidales bacterium]|jgi:hypothetical protein|nr:DUF4159 domain-containing protein [Bacteroidales bacterium]